MKNGHNTPADTIAGMIHKTLGNFPDKALLHEYRDGDWHGLTGSEISESIHQLALALNTAGIGKGDNVAILSSNSPNWVICDIAITCSGAASVAINFDLVPHQIEFIINDSDAQIVFVQNLDKFREIEDIWKRCPQVKQIILMDDCADSVEELSDLAAFRHTAVMADPDTPSLKELVAAIQSDDLATIVYTAGITGDPKGAALSNRNLVSNIEGILARIDVRESDTLLSVLPLSHAFERMAGLYIPISCGCSIYYSSPSLSFRENMLSARPSILVGVPYLVESLYNHIHKNLRLDSAFPKRTFSWAAGVGIDHTNLTLAKKNITPLKRLRHFLAKQLVFRKIINRLGGNLRFIACGGASLSPGISEFFYAIGIPVLEGYGITETSPVLSCNSQDEIRFGTVGKPLSNVELSIAADGEILARGPNVMVGYYDNPDDTDLVIDKKGWYHTGDLGSIDNDGFLQLTGRKKDLLISSGGKNIAPAPLETALMDSTYIRQAIVLGESEKFISALIVPDFVTVAEYLKNDGILISDPEALVEHKAVEALIRKEIDTIMLNFSYYERVREFRLFSQPFFETEITDTHFSHAKREFLTNYYSEIVAGIYAEDHQKDDNEV